MVHRGPDGEGLWVAPGREVALAFRRLAIVDLSTTANQPMTNEDGTFQELVEKGPSFKTHHSDSYEIVRSFFERSDRAAPGTDILNRMVYSEFKLRLPELQLMRVDKMGMSRHACRSSTTCSLSSP
jgi:asparagine synthetase B (glutamine-hydrolysing)